VGHAVEGTDQFAAFYGDLSGQEQARVDKVIGYLEEFGHNLGRPHADTVVGSRHANMKELRPSGSPIRLFFAFDPRRVAILLIGGDKSGDPKFYRRMIPIADDLYDQHLREIAEEDQDAD
jgi:hypothetical protein